MKSPSINDGVFAFEDALLRGSGKVANLDLTLGQDLLERIKARRRQDMETTVVVFAGATGSGKSSLFNAVLGKAVAKVAPVRPTTSMAHAAVGAPSDVLEWLQIPRIDHFPELSWLVDNNLVLVDLPDIDSVEEANRELAEQLIARADSVVWVTDPQKYGDAVLHIDFLRELEEHAAGMVVALNKTDTLTSEDERKVVRHLGELLAADRFSAPIYATSAATGTGVDALRDYLVALGASRKASVRRLAADLRTSGHQLAALVEEDGGSIRTLAKTPELDVALQPLLNASGAHQLADAAADSYRHRGIKNVGWLWTKWWRARKADPLARLHLKPRHRREPGRANSAEGGGSRAAVSSLRIPQAQQAIARSAVRRSVEAASQPLPHKWRRVVVADAEAQTQMLLAEVDADFLSHRGLYASQPRWWGLMKFWQWIFAVLSILGIAWLAAYWVAGFLQIRLPDPPRWGILTAPLAALIIGLFFGWLLAVVSRWLLAVGAKRRRRSVIRHASGLIEENAQRFVWEPVREELVNYERFTADLRALQTVESA